METGMNAGGLSRWRVLHISKGSVGKGLGLGSMGMSTGKASDERKKNENKAQFDQQKKTVATRSTFRGPKSR